MSDHVAQSEENADFTPYAIPAPEDKAVSASEHSATLSLTDCEADAESGSSARASSSSSGHSRRARSPEGATSGSAMTHSRADDALDDAIALANLLVAPLDPVQALGQALLVGMRLLPEASGLSVYAVESTTSTGSTARNIGALVQLATVERRDATESPALDLERHAGATLGLNAEAEQTLLDEQRPMEQGDATALPLRMVAPNAPALAGILLAHWETPAARESGARKRLSLLASSCAALLDRREQSLAHDAFLSLTVHELRSPLTAVKGYAQLLLRQARRLAVPPQTHQAIDAIEEQATRMADMISEMHDAVRIRRGDLELHPERGDIRPLVVAAVQQQRRLYPQHEMTLDAPDEPLVAEIDPQRLTQVVAALVNNAARYSPSGGPITVRVTSRSTNAAGDPSRGEAGEALVCVQDAGIGIAPADRVPIFEYLYRAPDAKRRHLSGLGLGLFVSRSLVERMGGHLWLEQTLATGGGEAGEQAIPRSGSTFCFTIPLAPDE